MLDFRVTGVQVVLCVLCHKQTCYNYSVKIIQSQLSVTSFQKHLVSQNNQSQLISHDYSVLTKHLLLFRDIYPTIQSHICSNNNSITIIPSQLFSLHYSGTNI